LLIEVWNSVVVVVVVVAARFGLDDARVDTVPTRESVSIGEAWECESEAAAAAAAAAGVDPMLVDGNSSEDRPCRNQKTVSGRGEESPSSLCYHSDCYYYLQL
jgi:hypothetical protein